MIAGENQDKLRVVRIDNVKVLINCVSRDPVPVGINALRGREDFDKFVQHTLESAPALANVPDK